MPVLNANSCLPADLLAACLTALSGSSARRVTFREDATTPTPTEMLLPAGLRARCRKVLSKNGMLPVRLYFSSKSAGKAVGRPPLPFRDDVMALVSRGHRVEAVAAFYGIHPQTPTNWGAKQPPKGTQVVATPAEFDEMVEMAVDHVSDLEGVEPVPEVLAGHWGVTIAEAKEHLSRIGKVISDLDGGMS